MIKSKLNQISIFAFVFFLLFAFQNCGKIEIVDPASTAFSSNVKTGISYLCLPSNYTLDSFFITNLNAKASVSGLYVDNDADGLSDAEEIAKGFNPNLRRTSGKILDSVCSSVDYGVNCSNFNISCSLSQNYFGINECDIIALNLNFIAQNATGTDSDRDGVPDYLELRINSFPNVYDSYNDLDFDLLNTITEAERSTSAINSNQNIAEQNYVQVIKTKLVNPSCVGEYWKIDILNLPTVPTKSFNDDSTGSLNLSHAPNENNIMVFLKIRPIDSIDPAKTFSGIFKVKYDMNNNDTAITINQSSLTYTGDVEQ